MVAGTYFVMVWAYDGNGSYTINVDTPKTTTENSFGLIDAINGGYIDIGITGAYDGSEESFDLKNGREVFYGECNIITIKSYVANDLDIIVPAGLILKAHDEEVEDKVVTMTHTINVKALSRKDSKLFAMSINLYKNVPILYTEFEVGAIATGDLLKIAEYIDENNEQTSSGQAAVWMVSDNAKSSELEQIGATPSIITSARGMLVGSGINPPKDDTSESDNDGFFGPLTNWICPVMIIIFVLLAVLSAFTRRARAKKNQKTGPALSDMKSMPYSVNSSKYPKGPQQKGPQGSPSSPPIKEHPPDPPPPPPPKVEKVEPVPHPAPKKPNTGN
jgi:hypothetical protein